MTIPFAVLPPLLGLGDAAYSIVFEGKLLSVKSSVPFPPTPSHLSEDKVQVPPAVYNFLSWLLYGDKSEAPLCLESCVLPPNQAMHRRIL